MSDDKPWIDLGGGRHGEDPRNKKPQKLGFSITHNQVIRFCLLAICALLSALSGLGMYVANDKLNVVTAIQAMVHQHETRITRVEDRVEGVDRRVIRLEDRAFPGKAALRSAEPVGVGQP